MPTSAKASPPSWSAARTPRSTKPPCCMRSTAGSPNSRCRNACSWSMSCRATRWAKCRRIFCAIPTRIFIRKRNEARSMAVWSPFRFNSGQQIANRFVIAPLTTDSSHEDGTATDGELEFIRRRAASGFGAAISSATYVEQDGRSWQATGAAHDGHLSSLRRLAEAMRASGSLAILQIYDGGRIAKPELIGEECLRAASAVASLRPGARTPRAMTSDEVENLIGRFREAASLARKAGFDGVEIHGANHYAVHQFFSPRANHRVDDWGGTLSKRMNFPLAVAQAVRDALGPTLIAGLRVTPFEAEADGYTLEDAKTLCHELARLGLDYISVSFDVFRKGRPTGEV